MTFEEMLASPDYTQFIVDYFDGESTPALEKEIYQKYLKILKGIILSPSHVN